MLDSKATSAKLGSDPELERAYIAATWARIEKAKSSIKQPELISQMVTHRYGRLQVVRKWFFRATIPLSIVSLLSCAFPTALMLWYSFFTPTSGVLLVSLVLSEILLGAGAEIQSEYKTRSSFSRGYKFVPSFSTLYPLLGAVGMGLCAIIVGFAHLYSGLEFTRPGSFSFDLRGLTSLYFSIVTFATVGYGDMFPKSGAAMFAVSLEILTSLLFIAVALATTVSWVSSTHQKIHQEHLDQRKTYMDQVEGMMKEAGVGVYADEKLMAEAEELVRSRRASQSNNRPDDQPPVD